ncbi:FHF complex subunit HOOK interacting protein 2A-like isoform X1 [Callorhinchus milii]|uniref:FHF complex subunit HOOK interacting protein 2A-like isoform X1 n=1 Tax=Callorhinchus milii TaxID=7868 RepID=UPI001C3F75FB|nr:FHF complex subunit HOOK interacting protein 2A-like isoform X1 [Callorhinchus milii]
MLDILVYEEKQRDTQETGPCLEYLLQHKILETLCTLGKAGYPPGMKQQVLILMTQLLSQIQQPLLPHVNVHRPVQLIRLCGQPLDSDTEKEEVQFLITVCLKLTQDPYLITFFIEKDSNTSNSPLPCSSAQPHVREETALALRSEGSQSGSDTDPERGSGSQSGVSPPVTPAANARPCPTAQCQTESNLVRALLTLNQSEKRCSALKAREALLLLVAVPEESGVRWMAGSKALRHTLTARLAELYQLIPDSINPGDVESLTPVSWRSHCASGQSEETLLCPAKEAVISFLSWLDYCDQMVKAAQPITAVAVAKAIRDQFFVSVLEPELSHVCEVRILNSTTLLLTIVQQVSSPRLLKELVCFLLGEGGESEAETSGQLASHPLLSHLIQHCNHLSDEISVVTLRVFEQLLRKPEPQVVSRLVLWDLRDRGYRAPSTGQDEGSNAESSQPPETEDLDEDPFFTDMYMGSMYPASDWLAAPTTTTLPAARESGNPQVNRVVNSFLCLVPDTVKTSHLVPGAGYDTYLQDAHRLFQGCCVNAVQWKWPLAPKSLESCERSWTFYEGHFLAVLFDRMAGLLDQPYDLNLQLTSVLSRLALFPHPHLDEYLLDPYLSLTPGSRSLFSVLIRVIGELMQRVQRVPHFASKLLFVRKQLMGLEPEEPVDHVTLLRAVIVLEEFCKELAAVSFVKHPAEPDQRSTPFGKGVWG